MTLTEIANKNGTDKGTEHYEAHGYTDHYEKYIPSTGNYTLLEIGVWHGDSLRMWKEYNPEMNLHGVDIDPRTTNYVSPDEFNIHIGDATSEEFLNSVIEICGAPNYIIDDGSHRHADIVNTFKILYPKLASGGTYFIEDLHASYAEREKTMDEIGKIINPGDMLGFVNHKLALIIKK
jgi:cephalosporin hydroxylase